MSFKKKTQNDFNFYRKKNLENLNISIYNLLKTN